MNLMCCIMLYQSAFTGVGKMYSYFFQNIFCESECKDLVWNLSSACTYPSADCGGDHLPDKCKMRIKLWKLKKPNEALETTITTDA